MLPLKVIYKNCGNKLIKIYEYLIIKAPISYNSLILNYIGSWSTPILVSLLSSFKLNKKKRYAMKFFRKKISKLLNFSTMTKGLQNIDIIFKWKQLNVILYWLSQPQCYQNTTHIMVQSKFHIQLVSNETVTITTVLCYAAHMT